MRNKTKMLISSTVAIIFTAITFSIFLTWIFHLYPSFPGYPIYNYFGAVVFYGIVSGLFWLVARGYYLDFKEEKEVIEP